MKNQQTQTSETIIFYGNVWMEWKMSPPTAVFAVVTFLSVIPGGMLNELRSTKALEAQHLALGSTYLHRRLKRGWIWKQLFVPEEDPTPRVIGQLKSDSNLGERSIKYLLSGEGAGDVFEIDEYSGEIRTLKKLDREEKSFYILQAQAINRRSNEPVEPESEFIIKVQDINDNIPQFQNEPYVSSIPEMCPIGTTVAQVTATDADDPMFGNNAKLIYSILQGEPYFSVEPKTGNVVTSWPNMDREARDEYLVVVQVKDMLGLSGGYSSSTTVTVSLTDVNDNGPTFQHHMYTFAVPENAAVGTTVGRITAKDSDIGINARMKYSLKDEQDKIPTFIIKTDPETQEGVILLDQPLNYETKRRYAIAAEAVNDFVDTRFLTLEEFRDRTTLRIVVEDVDEPPAFLSAVYTWKVPENAAMGTVVGIVAARDTDTANNPIRFSIHKPSNPTKAFQIDPSNGTITVAGDLDREAADWHNVTVEAKETTQNHLSSSVVVFIKVLDINDNVPRLARDYQPYICEGTQAGEVIQLLSAVDPDEADEGHHFYFSMVPEKNINPNFTIRDNQDEAVEGHHFYFSMVPEKNINPNFTIRDNQDEAVEGHHFYFSMVPEKNINPNFTIRDNQDEADEGHHFYFSMVPEKNINPNFTIRDNQDNTASIVSRRSTFTRKDRTHYFLPVVLADSGSPALSGTSTLTISVCSCQPAGHCPSGGVEALALSMGVSLQTLLGLVVCLVTFSVLSVLILLVRRHRQKQHQNLEEDTRELDLPETVSPKVLHYGEREGAVLDFSQPVVPLRPHPRRRERRLRREDVRASIRMSLRESHLIGPEDDVFRQFILDRLAEADEDPYAPPYDCLRSYAYEGSGSPTGSLSSLDSSTLEIANEVTACNPKPYLVRLTPWFGGSEGDTVF